MSSVLIPAVSDRSSRQLSACSRFAPEILEILGGAVEGGLRLGGCGADDSVLFNKKVRPEDKCSFTIE